MQRQPHHTPGMDLSRMRFYIRKLDSTTHVRTDEVPVSRVPLIGFIYVTQGEVLVETGGTPFLCQPGHVLIIPADNPFSIRYYNDATGYTGGFAPSAVEDSRILMYMTEPVHQAFWFDEAVFMAEFFNMMLASFHKHDEVFIEKGLDLFLSRIRWESTLAAPKAVRDFLESVFDPLRDILNLGAYAGASGISDNYLSRLVKQSTGRSVGAWIDIARVVRAKKLLSDLSIPVIDVAAAVGLEDQSYFARFFKKVTGQTPSEFRKTMQG